MFGRFKALFDSPFLRRVSWHVKRVGEKVDKRFFNALLLGLALFMSVAAVLIWLVETDRSPDQLGQTFYWAGATVLGLGEDGFVSGPVGWAVGWLLGVFGVAIVATITGAWWVSSLSQLVIDIVSGGEGSELYRVTLPDDCVGMSIDELSSKMRRDHRATLLAVSRDGTAHTNPAQDFRLQPDDDLVVVAESLGALRPLRDSSALA